MTNQTIDNNVYEALKDTVGEDYIAEMVDAFLEEGPQLLAALKQGLASNDVDKFRRAAHSMKSNAATFGAVELTGLAKELEDFARANDLEGAVDKIEPVTNAYSVAERALKSLQNA